METTLRIRNSALHLVCNSGIKLDSNDVGGSNYAKSLGLRVPHVGIKVLLNGSAERNTWLEAADVKTDLYVDIYTAPKGFKGHIAKQRAFVAEQDKLTDRAAMILSRMNGGRSMQYPPLLNE
jgi:carbohydrate-selective porin OprB